MSWLVALLGYLLRRVAHDMRVSLALYVAHRLHDAVSDSSLSPRKLAKLARLEDRLARLVRAIIHARMHALAGFGDHFHVERAGFQRHAACVTELRQRTAFLVAVLGSVDASCRRLLRLCIHAHSRRRHTETPRRTSIAITRLASFPAAIARATGLELSG